MSSEIHPRIAAICFSCETTRDAPSTALWNDRMQEYLCERCGSSFVEAVVEGSSSFSLSSSSSSYEPRDEEAVELDALADELVSSVMHSSEGGVASQGIPPGPSSSFADGLSWLFRQSMELVQQSFPPTTTTTTTTTTTSSSSSSSSSSSVGGGGGGGSSTVPVSSHVPPTSAGSSSSSSGAAVSQNVAMLIERSQAVLEQFARFFQNSMIAQDASGSGDDSGEEDSDANRGNANGNGGNQNFFFGSFPSMLGNFSMQDFGHGLSFADIQTMLMNQSSGGRPPLDENLISRLSRFQVSSTEHDLGDDPIDGCPIEKDDIVITLPCQHRFRESGIIEWLRRHDTCPICRKVITIEDVSPHNDPDFYFS